jgi:Holliday junction resolvase RusA-like endonuclease
MMQTALLETPDPGEITCGPTWRFEVLGHPEPQGSMVPFIDRRDGRAKVKASNATALRRWRKAVADQAREQLPDWLTEPIDGPVFLAVIYVFARHDSELKVDGRTPRKGAPRYPIFRADGDKLDRAIWDGITGVAVTNDARVVSWLGVKRFGLPGEAERAIVELTAL